MKWLEKLLYRMTAYLPCRIITGDGKERPYLERYKLFHLGDYFFVYLHRFLDSDQAGIHDHPWRLSVSLLLSGGYDEVRMLKRGDPESVVYLQRRPGTINIIRADDFHRVVIPEGRQAWSIFMHGRRIRRWGFLPELPDGRYGRLETDYTMVPERTYDELHWWRTAPKGKEAPRMPVDYRKPAG